MSEIQPVTIQDSPEFQTDDFTTPLLEQVKTDTNNLTPEQLSKGKSFITSYSNRFSKSVIDVGHAHLVEHQIELYNEHSFKQQYIPPSMIEEVKADI